jgi:hypothetical protein
MGADFRSLKNQFSCFSSFRSRSFVRYVIHCLLIHRPINDRWITCEKWEGKTAEWLHLIHSPWRMTYLCGEAGSRGGWKSRANETRIFERTISGIWIGLSYTAPFQDTQAETVLVLSRNHNNYFSHLFECYQDRKNARPSTWMTTSHWSGASFALIGFDMLIVFEAETWNPSGRLK